MKSQSEFVEVLNEKCINDWTVQHGWRSTVQDIIKPVLDQHIDQCIQNLSEYYDLMAESYHQHLLQLIDEKTKDKEIVSAQLSDEERKLQEDNDWLSQFREKLQTIERD